MLFLLLALQSTIAFTTVAQGTRSAIEDPKTIVVRTADEWQALWKTHNPAEKSPVVDFNQAVVLGVFLGTRPTAGYGVEIAAVKTEGSATVVEYREQRPARGGMLAQVLTSPFHLVRIAAPGGSVQFKKL